MLSDWNVPGTDDWYLLRLAQKLGKNFKRIRFLETYADGTFVVPIEADPSAREAYSRYAKKARLTFGNTIVDQTVGRMNLRGFRTAAQDDSNGDREADRIMRHNHFQVQFRQLQRNKSLHGESYFVVGLDEDNEPFLTTRDQWSVAVERDPIRPWIADAAIIVTRDEIGQQDIITLLRPNYFRVAVKEAKQTTIPRDGTEWSPGTNWEWATGQIPHGFTDRVPIVPFSNPEGLGEFEIHIDSLDRITEDILQRLTITAMQAFKQRAIQTGDQGLPERYPEDHPTNPGELINYDEIYKSGPAALWLLPKGAQIWESSQVDPHGLTAAEKKDLEHLAGISGTPLFAFSPDVDGSAEGAKLQRETIRTKIMDRRQRDGEALAETISLMFQAYGDPTRGDSTEVYTMWGQIEYVSKADVSEAARAAKQAGKSQRFIDEFIYELSPEEMELEAQNIRDETFQKALVEGANYAGTRSGGAPILDTEAVANSDASAGAARTLGPF